MSIEKNSNIEKKPVGRPRKPKPARSPAQLENDRKCRDRMLKMHNKKLQIEEEKEPIPEECEAAEPVVQPDPEPEPVRRDPEPLKKETESKQEVDNKIESESSDEEVVVVKKKKPKKRKQKKRIIYEESSSSDSEDEVIIRRKSKRKIPLEKPNLKRSPQPQPPIHVPDPEPVLTFY